MKNFLKYIYKSKKLILFIALVIPILFVINNSTTSKIESIFEQKRAHSVSDEFKLMKDKIKSINVLRYHGFDRYYVELKDNRAMINKDILPEVSKKIIIETIIPNKLKIDIMNANLSDNIIHYLVKPVESLLAPLLDKAVVLIPLLFFLIIIVFMYRQSKGKGKYEILLPENISGCLDDLIGMDELKKQVRPLINKHEFMARNKAYNVSKSFNLMFSGPPGTGKTKFASYLAKELGLPLISGSASSLETGLVGGGSGVLEALYKEAKKLKRCVVFLDEAQSLFMKRGAGSPHDSKHKDDTPNTLLAILDGVKTNEDTEIIWIFASNFNEGNMEVDAAMMRRFKLKLDFRLPNKEERITMFKLFLSKIDKSLVGTINYNYLGEISSRMSPAHIENIVDLASMSCSEEDKIIETADLYKAFEQSTIGTTDRATTAQDNEKRELIGFHELGHFIVEFDHLMEKYNGDLKLVQENMSLLKISTESVSKIGALGYVLSKSEEISLSSITNLENTVMRLYGGVVAEKFFYGEKSVTTGSGNDIQKATYILKGMFFDLGMYSNSKINYSIINSETKNNELIRSMELKSEELFKRTESIVAKHQDLISYLNPILLEKYILQSDELMDLIGVFFEKRAK